MIKRQYRIVKINSYKYGIELYHNGKLKYVTEKWLDSLDEFIDELKADGYTEGYLEQEINDLYKDYLYKLDNKISMQPRK